MSIERYTCTLAVFFRGRKECGFWLFQEEMQREKKKKKEIEREIPLGGLQISHISTKHLFCNS